MVTLRAPDGASESLQHRIELLNRDLDGLLRRLDTTEQNAFWPEVIRLPLERAGKSPIPAEGLTEPVREAIYDLDRKVSAHLRDLSEPDRRRFWELLTQAAETQIRQTQRPKARHGG